MYQGLAFAQRLDVLRAQHIFRAESVPQNNSMYFETKHTLAYDPNDGCPKPKEPRRPKLNFSVFSSKPWDVPPDPNSLELEL